MQKKFEIHVTYKMEHYPEMDDRLKKSLGQKNPDSGAGFGERDLWFEFKTKKSLKEALKKLRRFKNLYCISVFEYNDGEDSIELDYNGEYI